MTTMTRVASQTNASATQNAPAAPGTVGTAATAASPAPSIFLLRWQRRLCATMRRQQARRRAIVRWPPPLPHFHPTTDTRVCIFAALVRCHGEGCDDPSGAPCLAQSRVPPLPCLALGCISPEEHLACQRPKWLCSACTRRDRRGSAASREEVKKQQEEKQREKVEQG